MRDCSAQATVEAAFLLPTFLLLLLLALQPVCLLYTRAVMESTAAETARLMVTASSEGEDAYRAFALRRLAAVPDVSIFHAGGSQSWDISFSRATDTGGAVSVSIEGYVRPLPVLGAFAKSFGDVNARGDVRMSVEASYEGRPTWLEGDYVSWVEAW
ncbi:MAG: TadE/TadG family type IV pilus assembly protein [Coriobacteriaceae bacterium]|nr:TadE/TadG family type IV pilus assembly protein [Coriobacteriaceae bacterium]